MLGYSVSENALHSEGAQLPNMVTKLWPLTHSSAQDSVGNRRILPGSLGPQNITYTTNA